jgi:hypothetical protein
VAFSNCRYCGSELDRAREPLEVCPSCADSPLCDRCGHARSDHSYVFIAGGPAGCAFVIRDFQSLSAHPCACTGFSPVRAALRDAGFAKPDPDPLTLPLRVVEITYRTSSRPRG